MAKKEDTSQKKWTYHHIKRIAMIRQAGSRLKASHHHSSDMAFSNPST